MSHRFEVIEIKGNLVKYMIGRLRNKKTNNNEFRSILRILGKIVTYEVLNKELDIEKYYIDTPMARSYAVRFKTVPVIVAIMRAAMPLVEGGIELLDILGIKRKVGIVDAKRIEDTFSNEKMEIKISSFKIPKIGNKDKLIIFDVMLATGSTLIEILKRVSTKHISIISVIASRTGIENLKRNCKKNIRLYVCTVDKDLNKKGFIIPGLGDAGDRAF